MERIPGGIGKQQIYSKRRPSNNNANHNLINVLKNSNNGIEPLPLKLAYIYSTITTASETTRKLCRVKQTTAKMTNISPRTTTRSGMVATATAPAPEIVQVSLMNIYMPSIPEINPNDVKLRFPYQQLTKLEDEPEYKQMCVVQEEIYRTALSIKSSFGGGKCRHRGLVKNLTIYRIDRGEDWVVPATGGDYPIFRVNATENAKKQMIAEFISCKTNIKMSKVVEEQLKNQLLDSLPKAFILELCEGSRQYYGTTTLDILKHVFTN